MQEELKPCPFCGGKPELSPSGYVFCQKCLARTYELGNGAATWNKREHEREASINDLTVKVAQLEARLAALEKAARYVINNLPSPVGCDVFHHAKGDRHSFDDPCKPLVRHMDSVEQLRKALNPPRDPSQEGSDAHGKDK